MSTKAKRPLDRKGVFASILGEANEAATSTEVIQVRLGQLIPMPGQPRRHFDDDGLEELAASIRTRGVLQPLLVRPVARGEYEIVAGERRWRAARRAGLEDVPVIVREFSDREAFEAAIVENLQRSDLNPVDRADATARLISIELAIEAEQVPARLSALRAVLRRGTPEEQAGVAEDLAALDRIFGVIGGTWQTYLVHHLPILKFPADVLQAMRGGLEYTKGRLIANVSNEPTRAELLRLATEGASLEELRARIDDAGPRRSEVPERVRRVQQALRQWDRIERLPARRRKAIDSLLVQLEELLGTD